MRKRWLLCVLLGGVMAWGQAQPVHTPTPEAGPGEAPKAATPSAAEVPENAAVITIVGVCSPTSKSGYGFENGSRKSRGLRRSLQIAKR